MQHQTVWVHGTSVRIENPENLVSYNTYGWGTDVIFRKRETLKIPDSWFHASVPSSVSSSLWIGELEYTYLLSIEILFLAINCKLDKVDIYDGSTLIESPAWRPLDGEWRFTKGDDNNWNKYILSRPHRVFCGIGVSFHVEFDTSMKPSREDARLIVASVGANFRVDSPDMKIAIRLTP